MLALLRRQIAALSEIVSSLDCSSLEGVRAAEVVELFSRGEKLCASGIALAARRVEETGHFRKEGTRDASEWLAGVTGDSCSAAREQLETARNLSFLPSSLEDAFRSGGLSQKQANEVRKAAEKDPDKTDELVFLAGKSSLRELREEAGKVIDAALSKEEDEERHARVQRERHLQTWKKNGALMGEFSLTPESGAHLLGALESLAGRLFEQARAEGRSEPHAAYMADALVALATSEGKEPSRGSLPSYEVVMRVDLEALVRGHLLPDEECSIDGVGHVPVSLVQSYLDRAKVRLVVERHEDVVSVFSMRRNIPRALDIALRARDRTCVVPGCRASFFLERDHVQEFAKGGPTTLSNLVLLCSRHHKMKTNEGFRIKGRPGAWRWLKPDGSPAGPYEQEGGETPPGATGDASGGTTPRLRAAGDAVPHHLATGPEARGAEATDPAPAPEPEPEPAFGGELRGDDATCGDDEQLTLLRC